MTVTQEIAKSHSKHPSYLRFWGKQRGAIEGGASWHAAAYHCLDVAASARALLEANDLLRRQLAELLAIPEWQVVDLLTFWMALHDVGKFSAPFSAQIEDLRLPEMGERATDNHFRSHQLARGDALDPLPCRGSSRRGCFRCHVSIRNSAIVLAE